MLIPQMYLHPKSPGFEQNSFRLAVLIFFPSTAFSELGHTCRSGLKGNKNLFLFLAYLKPLGLHLSEILEEEGITFVLLFSMF